MRKTAVGILVFFGAVLTAVGVGLAKETALAHSATEIIVGYTDSERMVYETNGGFDGYGVAYLNKLAEHTGWTYRYVSVPEEELLARLKEGQIDLLCNVAETVALKEGFVRSKREAILEYALLCVNENNYDIFYHSISDLNHKRIAINSSAGLEPLLISYAQKENFSYEPVYYSNAQEVMEALQEGTVDIALTSNTVDLSAYRCVAKMGLVDAYFVTTEQNKMLMEQLDAADEALKTDRPFYIASLYESYFGRPGVVLQGMTRPEYELIQNSGKLRVAYNSNNYPLEYYDEKTGQYRGVYADAMRLIAQESGLRFEFVPMDDIQSAWRELENGEIDLITDCCHMPFTMEEAGIRCSNGYLQIEYAMITRHGEILPEEAMIALPENDIGLQQYIEQHYPKWTIEWYGNEEICMNIVSNKRADATLVNTVSLQTVYNINIYDNLAILPTRSVTLPCRIAIGRKNGELTQQVINKAIVKIPTANFEQCIVENAINISYEVTAKDMVRRYIPHITIVGLLITLTFVVSLKGRENHYRHLAMTDSLTGIWNGTKFRQEANHILNRNKQETYCIVSMDIEKFKYLNNDFGTKAADSILCILAQRIKAQFSEYAIYARDMADIFLIMLPPSTALEEILSAIGTEISFENNGKTMRYHISLKFGLCEIPPRVKAVDVADYINNAVIARKTIKALPGAEFAYYDDRMAENVAFEILIERKMEEALKNQEFQVYYQPKYDLQTKEIVGAEALVRWQSQEMGFVMPDQFIPLFEKNGFIIELDFYVYEMVLRQMAKWKKRWNSYLSISVNVSRIHIESGNFLNYLLTLTDQYQIPHEYVELELTETILGSKNKAIMEFIIACKAERFKVSIDDFGSGYSSLNLLKSLPVDVLKIDKGFLDEAEESKRSRIIVEKVVEMAQKINIATLCEGVETEKQAAFLRKIGCGMAQGYLYSKPVTVQAFEALIETK